MYLSVFNAFLDGGDNGGAAAPGGRSAMARLAPMAARLEQSLCGWRLELAPMRAFDALRIWPEFADGEHSVSVLCELTTVSRLPEASRAGLDSAAPAARSAAAPATLRALASQHEIAAIDCFDEEILVVDDLSQRELLAMAPPARLRSVLVNGPVERRDALAIRWAFETGRSPLQVEVRAAAAIEVAAGDRTVMLEVRRAEHAFRLVAENFRHYLAALCQRPAMDFSPPPLHQIERLFSEAGSIRIEPRCTQVYSNWIDIGVNTSADAAERSLIYDLPSATWHDEP